MKVIWPSKADNFYPMPGETSLEKAWFKQGDEGKIGEKLHIEEPSETNETTEEETDEKKQPEEEKAA